jgi:hypothetical protein
MGLNTEQRQDVVFFIGDEVEHTVCYGMKTLFVVGTPDLAKIIQLADDNECKHIYLGTSQSFNPESPEDWKRWDIIIKPLLSMKYWVSLDFDVKYAEQIHEDGWTEYDNFVPMISVKIPYIKLFNYNATLKIDDLTWGKTNPGVWTHHLPTLMNMQNYTHWDQYVNDTPVVDTSLPDENDY